MTSTNCSWLFLEGRSKSYKNVIDRLLILNDDHLTLSRKRNGKKPVHNKWKNAGFKCRKRIINELLCSHIL
ncbi:hypothetical protein NMS_0429 [Nonlabens marinus S1-08]|uniref:Uncharacterized protein n=2 Tax=Nonlabens TaxID=363408 RepID=W8VUA8_9FLAO|nr:hypothetical protein NMS_0429 [Nonlabens marinus S1-08]